MGNRNDIDELSTTNASVLLSILKLIDKYDLYGQNGARLNVIHVLASRSQALRYLLVRWDIELSNMVVFVGGSGDTDYEGLLGGIHKTVILKGLASDLRELHGNRSYPIEDVTPLNSPYITEAEECGCDAIKASLEKLGISLPKP